LRRFSPALRLLAFSVFASRAFGQQAFANAAVDPTHHLTANEFVRDIGADFAGLFSTHSIVPLSIGAAAYGLATIPEQNLERHFARGDVWGAWANPGKYIGHPIAVGGAAVSLFALGRKSHDARFRSFSYSLLQGMILAAPFTYILKPATHRLRPNELDHMAFPSGHSVDTFLFATVISEHYGWKAGIPAYAVAAYVSATRLEERKHHLTDVAGGAAIGVLAGRTVSRRIHGGRTSRFSWQVYPSRRGVTAAVQIPLP
jgi:membrane-associated phospholipid phosphatase